MSVEQKINEIDYKKKWKSNPMLTPFIDKIVVNICLGGAGAVELQKASMVLSDITGKKTILIPAKKSIKEWDVRKGKVIATKATLRGQEAADFLIKALVPFDNRLLRKAFDNYGNVSFGLDEHIKIPKIKYDPDLGIFGFNVSIKIVRPGMRIKTRKKDRRKVGQKHYVSRKEAVFFMQEVLKVEVVDIMEDRYY